MDIFIADRTVSNAVVSYNQPNGLYPPFQNSQPNLPFVPKSPYRSPYHSPYRSPEPSGYQPQQRKSKGSTDDSNLTENHVNIRRQLFDDFKECRQCGLRFQSRDNLNKHQ